MAKKTNITNVINVNSIGQESFAALLDVQKKSVEHLDTISAALKQSLITQRSSAIEELIIANNQQAQTQIFKDISKTLEDIAKSLKLMAQSSATLTSGNTSSSKTPSAVATVGKEEKQEAQRSQEAQKSVLVKIEKNTEGLGSLAKASKPAAAGGDGGLGLGLTALAAGLGVVVGAMKAQLDTIKYFSKLLMPTLGALFDTVKYFSKLVAPILGAVFDAIKYFAKLLTPEFVITKAQKAIASFAAGISMSYDLLKLSISEKISSMVKAFDSVVDTVKVAISEKLSSITKVFDNIVDTMKVAISEKLSSITKVFDNIVDTIKVTISEKFPSIAKIFDNIVDSVKGFFTLASEESTIAKFIKNIMSGLNVIIEPFADAFKIVREFFSGPTSAVFETIKGIFSTIGSTFDDFAKLFSTVAKVTSKLLVPLNIIMTLWDTVKGAIEGYEEEGIIGGIKGAIKGFFNSLIFGPIDMIKDAMAWVLGFFGFENAKETLKSFSLQEMFKSYVDMIFSPIDTFKAIVSKISDFFSVFRGLEIPGFGFKIPDWIPKIGGKEFKFGPWYPFGKNMTQMVDGVVGDITKSQQDKQDAESAKIVQATKFFMSGNKGSDNQIISPEEVNAYRPNNSDLVRAGTNQVNALRENKAGGATTVVAPAISTVNNRQTQVARIEAPIRNNDSTYDRYMYDRVGW